MYFAPGRHVFGSDLFTNFKVNINKAPDLKILDTWARKGFGVQRHSACQLPSFKPYVGFWKNTSRYTVTILVGTQYYHIPSIRNGEAARAARATNELASEQQSALPLCGSMLVYPLTCVKLARAYEKAWNQHSNWEAAQMLAGALFAKNGWRCSQIHHTKSAVYQDSLAAHIIAKWTATCE